MQNQPGTSPFGEPLDEDSVRRVEMAFNGAIERIDDLVGSAEHARTLRLMFKEAIDTRKQQAMLSGRDVNLIALGLALAKGLFVVGAEGWRVKLVKARELEVDVRRQALEEGVTYLMQHGLAAGAGGLAAFIARLEDERQRGNPDD